MWLFRVCCVFAFGLCVGVPSSLAQEDQSEDVVLDALPTNGATVAVLGGRQLDPDAPFVTLSTGGLFLIRGQRVIVTQEPPPVAVLTDAPPPPPADALQAPTELAPNTIWVPGRWTHGEDGFVWVAGREIATKPGHAFVPPRWVFVNGRHLFFSGFFVPHRVWVRSFFNTFHFSGDPSRQQVSVNARDRGPYWPIGLSGRPGVSASRGRGPYWPIGLGPPTVLSQRAGTIVGLPNNNRR